MLAPGAVSSFELTLDNRDLARNVHPVQVVVKLRPEPAAEGITIASFWVRPEVEQSVPNGFITANERTPVAEPRQQSQAIPAVPAGDNYGYGYQDNSSSSSENYPSSIDETLLEETIDTIGVTASDPNCTQIQNLKLYYHRAEPDKPVFISWLNPRCCQRKGCVYTVWTGPAPDKLRLLVEGNKPGATISELLQGLQPGDSYFEVVVETSNGARKAGYAIEEGPLYGFEAILAYRDKLNPPKSDPIVLQKTPETDEEAAQEDEQGPVLEASADPAVVDMAGTESAKTAAAFRWNGTNGAVAVRNATPVEGGDGSSRANNFEYNLPEKPITDFTACHYRRETSVTVPEPVVPGSPVTITYDYSRDGYRYTLYQLPAGESEWVVAPGTKELQTSSTFRFDATPMHTGKFLVLAYKPAKGWGCLSDHYNEAIEITVESEE